MRAAADLDLPFLDPADTTVSGTAFHDAVREVATRSWLARQPLGYVVLDRDAGEFFLRCRDAVFPGQKIAELFGVESGPLREEIDRNLLHLDGEVHRRLRSLVGPSFTPRAADRWRPLLRQIVAELFAQVEADGRCDVVPALAVPYPARTIATVMGAPLEDALRLAEWSQWIQRQFDPPALMADRPRIEQACTEFYAWCDELLARKRAQPADDLVSQLLAVEEQGDRLSDVELVHLVLNVLIGGVDTTQAQLAHALRLFAEHPDQWALLGREPERAPAAVQEVLRHEPITPFTARITLRDVAYRDVLFPGGTVVMVCTLSGNRDGAGPDAFDITAERPGARLMTFGAGVHFCLGANLARAELEEALAFLVPRMPGLRLDGDPVHGTVQGVYGMERLPVAWEARDA
ncbi:MAG TPA: cytochrome P450 [Mycobacteriales bacterium]|nr:cytochrome P450 [Mycobacteriales bacterium]